jgi:hypothetical protein
MTSKASGQFNNTGGKGLGDYRHAARVFVDGDFALAPRLKFQYHVQFSGKGLGPDLNLLVKSVDLPKFQVTNETVFQYNRKRVIQTGMTYQPITIKFHDDNSNTVRSLWQSYYAYYFSDSKAAEANLYGKSSSAPMSFYGLEKAPIKSFLDFIKVHTFAKRQWAGYKLINPIIVGWVHDTMNYSASEAAEHTMTIAYEAVVYDSGSAAAGSPPGFGTGRYDSTPSPLTLGGGPSFTAVSGTSGVRTGAEQVFGAKTVAPTPENTFSMTGKTLSTIDTYNNVKTLQNTTTAQAAVKVSFNSAATGGQGALNNIAFPVNNSNNAPTVGTLRNITGSTNA